MTPGLEWLLIASGIVTAIFLVLLFSSLSASCGKLSRRIQRSAIRANDPNNDENSPDYGFPSWQERSAGIQSKT
jgi:hypothetical protein